MNILDKIVQTKHLEIDVLLGETGFEELYRRAQAVSRPAISFSEALRRTSKPAIIAEFKRKSPSKGFINRDTDPTTVVKGYAEKGATAISVLTDREYFGGSLDDLAAARRVVDIPLLRKDFIIDPCQICEAKIAGADAILLIAAALTPEWCVALAGFARGLGLEVLLEIHNEAELSHINPDVDMVGVNNRDLTTFVTDTAVSERLAGLIPSEFVKISESGISSPDTVRKLHGMGYGGFLMGENFMKHPDPVDALEQFIKSL